jgi:hypothetical protein
MAIEVTFPGTVQLEFETNLSMQVDPDTVATIRPLTPWLVQAEFASASSSIAPKEKMLAIRKAGMPNFRRRLNRGFFCRVLRFSPRPEFVLGKRRLESKAPQGSQKPLESSLPNTRNSI